MFSKMPLSDLARGSHFQSIFLKENNNQQGSQAKLSSDTAIISSPLQDNQHGEPAQSHCHNDLFINKINNIISLDDTVRLR